MKQLRCIIVDDEPKASKLLSMMIEELNMGIQVLGVHNNPILALEEIEERQPDFLLLDIDMPHLSGFELLAKLKFKDCHVIFVTGYDHYALDAIKVSAIDYLVKPIEIDELKIAIEKVEARIEQSSQAAQNRVFLENLKRANHSSRTIGIPSVEGIDFIPIADIFYLEAIDRYTKVIAADNREILSSYSIGEFLKLLGDSLFFQCHRSFIINLDKIVKYHKEGVIHLSDGMTVPLARRRKEAFLLKVQNRIPSREK